MVDKIEWMKAQSKRYMLTPSVENAEEKRLKKIMNEVSETEEIHGKDIRYFSSEEILDFLQKGKFDFNEAWMKYRTINKFCKDTYKEIWSVSVNDIKNISLSDEKIITEEVYIDIMTSEILSSYKFIIGALYNGFNNEDILLMRQSDIGAHALRRQNGEWLTVDDLLIRTANTASTTYLHRSHPLEEEDYVLKLPKGAATERLGAKRITNSIKYAKDAIGYSLDKRYLPVSGIVNRLNEVIRSKGVGSISELWQQQEIDEIRKRYQKDSLRSLQKSVRKFLIF